MPTCDDTVGDLHTRRPGLVGVAASPSHTGSPGLASHWSLRSTGCASRQLANRGLGQRVKGSKVLNVRAATQLHCTGDFSRRSLPATKPPTTHTHTLNAHFVDSYSIDAPSFYSPPLTSFAAHLDECLLFASTSMSSRCSFEPLAGSS